MRRLVVRFDAVLRHAVYLGLALPALFFVALPSFGAGEPTLFPGTRAGWEPRVMDSRNTAPYLSFHKAAAMRRMDELAAGVRTTPNQLAYDARYYDLDLDLNPATRILTGHVIAKVSVMSGPLTTLDLDLDNLMTVSAVTSGGVSASWTHANDILSVNLDRAYATGEWIEVSVQYSGNPAAGGSFGWDTWAGHPMIWTLSEPFGGRTWWPSKDWSDDKADSVRVRVTAPTGMITASNGSLVELSDNGTTAVARWFERHPIATYLVSIASYPYSVSTDYYTYSPTDSMEIKFFIFPDHVGDTAAVNAKVKEMIGTYAGIFGQYPFVDEKYGHAEFLWGGGMEHQTCTSLGYFGESVVAHELSHQWWGDMITCEDFHHVWLNEGFATYCEALWSEATYGTAAYHEDLSFNKYFGPGTIYVPDLNDWNRIFDGNLSYNKASWVLHMLRRVLGDADFFASIRAYYDQYKYSVATTEDFRDVCEAVSGKDLDYFFQEWIYGEYYPEYSFTYTASPVASGYDVLLTIEQTQSWQIFRMPIDVTITTQSGEQAFVVDDAQAAQQFTLHVDEAPLSLKLDKDDWVLKTVQEPVVNPPFDRGVLLVNGVDWDTYGNEIYSAYQDKAFWGDYTIDFWDHFNGPAGGYPATLPAPLGHGYLPGDVIGHYRDVIWVGNNYGGDLSSWFNSPILSYLEAGGNLLLMTRQGDQFITEPLRQYLGLSWVSGSTLYDCIANYPGLTNITRLGTQNSCSLFDMQLTQIDSRVIYKADQNYNPDRGIGVWRKPIGGGIYRPDGAQFIFLSGRPYRWTHAQLKTNIMYMLANFFQEPVVPAGADDTAGVPASLLLSPANPNPLLGATGIRFALPRAGEMRLEVLDVAGRRVRRLAEGPMSAGNHAAVWDGRDDDGRDVPAGVYWARLLANGESRTQKLTMLR